MNRFLLSVRVLKQVGRGRHSFDCAGAIVSGFKHLLGQGNVPSGEDGENAVCRMIRLDGSWGSFWLVGGQ